MAGLNRNRWPFWIGITGRFASECAHGREVIVLRDEDKNGIEFKHTDFTKRSSDSLKVINECLANTWIDVCITDDEYSVLRRRLLKKDEDDEGTSHTIDFGAHALRRIFNNKSWDEGGRFYGGWWQSIPREYRKRIHLNGKRTIELDFSGMHPAMMYAQIDAAPPPDPYDIGIGTVSRTVIKKAFNSLINAPNQRIDEQLGFDSEQSGLSWKELLDAIRDFHHPVKEYFNTGEGLRLQRKDSDIAETVMRKFTGMAYPCLPVHDSFIVHHALADDLNTAMLEAYEEIVGVSAKVDAKAVWEYQAPEEPEFVNMGDVDGMFDHGEYQEYEQRRLEWYAYKEKEVA